MKNSTSTVLYILCFTFCAVLFTAIECCSDSQVRCADDSACISTSSLCNFIDDCPDASDEDQKFCEAYETAKLNSKNRYYDQNYGYRTRSCNTDGQFKCSTSNTCYWFPAVCSSCTNILFDELQNICRMLTADGKLNVESFPQKAIYNVTFESILTEFNHNFNHSSFCDLSPNECPPLYSKVEDQCVAFFSITQVTWFDAQNFCKSIKGHLAIIDDAMKFFKILKYINTEELKADFWLGGRTYSKEGSNLTSWRWTNDVQMFARAPFWALSRKETDPCPSGDHNLECSRVPIHPLDSSEGRCVAMTYENNFYLTDHSCYHSKSPLCIFDSKHNSNMELLKKDIASIFQAHQNSSQGIKFPTQLNPQLEQPDIYDDEELDDTKIADVDGFPDSGLEYLG